MSFMSIKTKKSKVVKQCLAIHTSYMGLLENDLDNPRISIM